jgi:hypothetical protein
MSREPDRRNPSSTPALHEKDGVRANSGLILAAAP